MDDSLRIIQYLYGEEVDDPDFAGRVAADDDLRREFDRLQETKSALDQRSTPSPDAAVVDRITDRAAEPARPDTAIDPAPNRTARAPARRRTRRLQNAGAVLALLLAAGIGWWYTPGDTDPANSATSASTTQQQDPATAPSKQAQGAEALPEWDDRDKVVRLHRRIERLQTQSRSDPWSGAPQPASRTRP